MSIIFVGMSRKPDFKLAFLTRDREIAPLVYMESDLTQSAVFYKLWAWGDKNKKLLIGVLIALVVVGIGLAFYFSHQSEEQSDANNALSKLTTHEATPTAPAATPEALLGISTDYAGTDAAQRAELLAAGEFFAAGKFDQAHTQFEKFLQNYSDSPFKPQAGLGLAACLDAEGKTNDAVSAYQSVVEHYPNMNVAAAARMALARLFVAQGKFSDARTSLQDVVRTYPGPTGSEAAQELQALNAAHPEIQPTNRPAPPLMTAPLLNPQKH